MVIENPKGSQREWYDSHAKEKGTTTMLYDYGYFKHSKGMDKDEVDCYLGPWETSPHVFVIRQLKKDTGEFDETKCMMGFSSSEEAKTAYLAHYNSPKFFGGITRYSLDTFRKLLEDSNSNPSIIKNELGESVK